MLKEYRLHRDSDTNKKLLREKTQQNGKRRKKRINKNRIRVGTWMFVTRMFGT